MTPTLRSRMVQAALTLALALSPCVSAVAQEAGPELASARLSGVTVSEQPDAMVVAIKTSGAARYHAEFIDSPNRLVLDFQGTVYSWRKTPLHVSKEPVRQVRGSQYRKGVARVVVEFSHKVGYTIREDREGLVIVVPTTATATSERGSEVTSKGVAAASPRTSPAPIALAEKAAPERPAGEEKAVELEAPKAIAIDRPKIGKVMPAPARRLRKPAPFKVAQAPTATVKSADRLISLEFKDADVVNLLRILAAESGRNIVIGDDVKGKMSISLRNVPWHLALDTILEARGLQKVERDGVLRIVSTERLTKEREAAARVEEAKIKGEAEARAKLAEAQVKEAEALSKKLAAEAARREQEAKGPLREETVRLSYADPEEVAKTLQGILGIPAEGGKLAGPGYLGLPGPPNPELGVGYQAAGPAAQLPTVVSVSQDVLAKGLSIRAHKPTNTLFLRLYERDLERVKKLIHESLDIPLPQVKIEARMEILDRTALEQLGVQWGGAIAQNAGSQTLVGQGLQTTAFRGQTVPFLPGQAIGNDIVIDPTSVFGVNPPNPSFSLINGLPVSFQTGLPLGGNIVNLPVSALPTAGALPAGGLMFGLVGDRFNINIALQALAQQGKTRTLARPEIVTVENNKAVMSLGEEIPYATISSAGTQIQFKEALLKLEVTPTVITEGDATKIKLIVVVENNSRGDVVNLGNAGSPPAINRRKAETQVLINEGDRLVIGGVTTSSRANTTRKVPVFGDIPIIGHLFKHHEDSETGRELVVFVTPSVIRTVDHTSAK